MGSLQLSAATKKYEEELRLGMYSYNELHEESKNKLVTICLFYV